MLVFVLELAVVWRVKMNRVERRENIILTNKISGFVMVQSDEK
jgi:hypothetical protein